MACTSLPDYVENDINTVTNIVYKYSVFKPFCHYLQN
ncbi:hypothetical protein EMIT0P74_20350 [Pseudomonas sp. IT-P74]